MLKIPVSNSVTGYVSHTPEIPNFASKNASGIMRRIPLSIEIVLLWIGFSQDAKYPEMMIFIPASPQPVKYSRIPSIANFCNV